MSVEPLAGAEWWRRLAERRAGLQVAAPRRHADSPIALWALMAFTGILLLAPQAIFPALAPFRIALLAAGVAVIAHVLGRWVAGRPITIVTREMKIAVCLLGWAIVTVPFSYWPGGSVATLTDLFLKSLVLFLLIVNTVTTVGRFRQFAWGLTLMSVPIAATALMSYLSGTFVRGTERITGYDSPLATNPNDLALMLNIIVPFALALLRTSRGPLLRAALLAILALDVTAVVLTFSRGGFLTLAVILAITVTKLLRSPKRAWGVALLAVLVLCLPLLPASYWHRIATITDIESDETGSAQARRDSSLGALRFLLTHPVIGAGIGASILALNEQIGPTWTEVHNIYLQYAVDLGLPGLGFFLALFASCLASASAARHGVGHGRDAQDAAHLADATRLSLIAFGVAALLHPVAYNFYFYYLAGLAVAANNIARDRIGPRAGGVLRHA
jgi:O-antigen ligase